MSIFQHRAAQPKDYSSVLDFLPPDQLGCPRGIVLSKWQRWHRDGSLSIGIIEAVEAGCAPVIAGVGITAWISDDAVNHIHQHHKDSCAVRLYGAAVSGTDWLLAKRQVAAAHSQRKLNLLIVHFWPDPEPQREDFAAFFFHSVSLFRELHDGFGVGQLFQEVPAEHSPMLAAAGMKISRPQQAGSPGVLMGLSRTDARLNPGSAMSFVFLTPPSTLNLRDSEQRVVGLALRQLTDEDIAIHLRCSREYVRKLWSRVYDALHASAALEHDDALKADLGRRGKERRRRALEFFRAHPEELRPGMNF